MTCVDSSVARIPAFQAGGPGSIPGRRIFIFDQKKHCSFLQQKLHPPGIEPGTYRVLGGRHNQLDHGCYHWYTFLK